MEEDAYDEKVLDKAIRKAINFTFSNGPDYHIDSIDIVDIKNDATFGLTEERYNQMMQFYDNDASMVKATVFLWGATKCNKGYDIFSYDGGPVFCIEAIGDVGAFSDKEAVQHAIEDGIKIIPIAELPENLPNDLKFFGWIDTLKTEKPYMLLQRNQF